ncbi:MAG: hypothetical protein ACRDPF_10995 [Streptosporangiaceae bacterium]
MMLFQVREVSTGGSVIDPQVVEALVRGRARVREMHRTGRRGHGN